MHFSCTISSNGSKVNINDGNFRQIFFYIVEKHDDMLENVLFVSQVH